MRCYHRVGVGRKLARFGFRLVLVFVVKILQLVQHNLRQLEQFHVVQHEILQDQIDDSLQELVDRLLSLGIRDSERKKKGKHKGEDERRLNKTKEFGTFASSNS